MSKSQLGWVYVLHNPSFKDNMIKIGFTNRPTPQQRAQELSQHTGVPTEFEVVFAVQVANAQALETRVHQILQHKRARNNREFFECGMDEAVQTILNTAGRDVLAKIDRRNALGKIRLPEKKSAPRKNAPKNKAKSRGLIFTMMLLVLLFLAAMWVVGWNVEQKEKQAAPSAQTLPETPKSSEKILDNQSDEVQAAWLKIAPEIRETLQEEQQQWLAETQKRCAQSADKAACWQKENAKRVKYLKDFSI